jgi:hypothetical protein
VSSGSDCDLMIGAIADCAHVCACCYAMLGLVSGAGLLRPFDEESWLTFLLLPMPAVMHVVSHVCRTISQK